MRRLELKLKRKLELKLKRRLKPIGLLALSLLVAKAAMGQEADSVATSLSQLELYQTESRWSEAVSSALSAQPWCNYGRIEVDTRWTNGSYHRAQEAASSTHIDARADGAVMLGNYRVRGNIDLHQHWNRGVQYALMMNPLRDMPYQWADSTGGDWRQQQYQLGASIISPMCGAHFSWAVDVGLQVGRGAKNTDPRPQDNTNRLQAIPSLTWHNRVLQTSLYVGYFRTRQRTELMLYNSSEPQKLYLMKGLGQYTWEVMSTSQHERQFKGDGWQGGVQLGHQWKRHGMMLGIDVDNGTEDVYDMIDNSPRHVGRVYSLGTGIHMDWQIRRKRWLHVFTYKVNAVGLSGREFIQVFNSSADVNRWETLAEAPARYTSGRTTDLIGYEGYRKDEGSKDYRWKFGLQTGYVSMDEDYEVMNAQRYTNDCITQANVYHRFPCGSRLKAMVGLDLTWKSSMADDYQDYRYSPRETDDTNISQGLMQHDWNYLTEDYFRYAVVGRLEWNCLPASLLYLQLSGSGLTTSPNHHHRRQMQVSLGYLF